MIEFMDNIRTERRKIVGPILLACLLFLRLPYLIGASALFPKTFLIGFVFNNSTFFITALLILWERKRLSEFHITLGALRIIIWAPLVSLLVGLVLMLGLSLEVSAPLLIHILISFWLLWDLKKSNFKNTKQSHHWFKWIIIAIVVGICIGIVTGYIIGLQDIAGVISKHRTVSESVLMLQSVKSWVTVLPLFMVQLTAAATLEEPLFRGFLWGYLRIMGWKDKWILLFQAFLFWIGHIYYWNSAPYSFWIIVPVGGLVLGLLAWKSHSIVTSMVSHGLFNSIGDFLAHY